MRRDRGFLNPDHGLAAYQYECDGTYNVLELRDCVRSISLDFRVASPHQFFLALTKLTKLMHVIEQFQRDLVAEYRESMPEDAGSDPAGEAV